MPDLNRIPLPSSSSSSYQSLIEHYLNLGLFDTARFYAERQYFTYPTPDSAFYLACCYHRQGKNNQVYIILQDAKFSGHSMSVYLLAQVCLALGKLEEAENTLVQPLGIIFGPSIQTLSAEVAKNIPGGAAGVYLLGRVNKRQQKWEMAAHCFRLAIEMDPFMWSAISELSELGESIDLKTVIAKAESKPSTSAEAVPRYHLSTRSSAPGKESLNTMATPPTSTKAANRIGLDSANVSTPYNPLAAKTSALSALDRLTSGIEGTPGSIMALGLSTMSLRMPAATPSFMPSPITRSMLSNSNGAYTGSGVYTADHRAMMTMDSTSGSDLPRLESRDIGKPRGALFGDPTPSTSLVDGDTVGELTSAFHKGGHVPGRRVSFGTTARLSFSGQFDSHFPGSNDTSAEIATKLVTAEDDHPYKLQRGDSASADLRKGPGSHAIYDVAEERSESQHMLPSFELSSPSLSPIRHQRQSDVRVLDSASRSVGLGRSWIDGAESQDDGDAPGGTERKARPNSSFSHGSLPMSPTSSTNKKAQTAETADTSAASKEKVKSDDLMGIVSIFAKALQLLCNYNCHECIEVLQQLPNEHFSSGYCCQLMGRAYIEMNEYRAAVTAFREMIRLEPFRVQGLELLSSALWQLRLDKDLSALAQQVLEVDKYCPETWCVLGNSFSLLKEPDTAIRFFQRALQIDPQFTYAFTLCGHEYVTNEDMEKAVTSFRNAILCNERHYNAWYGLGSIYYRQERYEMSEYHFRRAKAINCRSSVLDCYLGMALNAQGTAAKIAEALDVLSLASETYTNNPQLRFQRANILFSQDELEEALAELLIVERAAPKEPPVHAMLGQIYQRLGRVQESILHLNIAIDLDPKEANSLKAIMDNFDEPMVAFS